MQWMGLDKFLQQLEGLEIHILTGTPLADQPWVSPLSSGEIFSVLRNVISHSWGITNYLDFSPCPKDDNPSSSKGKPTYSLQDSPFLFSQNSNSICSTAKPGLGSWSTKPHKNGLACSTWNVLIERDLSLKDNEKEQLMIWSGIFQKDFMKDANNI